MSWSLGETHALAIKAARGAGFPWGLAEEAGFAARWLQAHALPGAVALSGYLSTLDRCNENSLPACPLALGTRLSDNLRTLTKGLPRELGEVAYPLLLLPFAASAVEKEGKQAPTVLSWSGARFVLSGTTLQFDAGRAALLAAQGNCSLRPYDNETLVRARKLTRVPDSAAEAIVALGRFAARTYAPSTERSRLTGAGAQTNDND